MKKTLISYPYTWKQNSGQFLFYMCVTHTMETQANTQIIISPVSGMIYKLWWY
ncbi:MAG: hypothetical protein LBL58_14470 [Tannerellaceae bacterium]|jgi:hypothetical protein|nr:hypothetical protein [Tannerellaceae bacterium]